MLEFSSTDHLLINQADIDVTETFDTNRFIIYIKELFSGDITLSILISTESDLSYLPTVLLLEKEQILIVGLESRLLFISVSDKRVKHIVNLDVALFFIYNCIENNALLAVAECAVFLYDYNGLLLHCLYTNDIIISTQFQEALLTIKTDSEEYIVDLLKWK